jgi:hypothetical protein
MSVALLVIGDGRDDVHDRSWESAQQFLPAIFDFKVVVDDRDHKLGFAGAIEQGWDKVLEGGAEWCFWLELDFLFRRQVPLVQMRKLLQAHPHLVQMALLRGPVNEQEQEAGGVVEQHPDDYIERNWLGYKYLEHRRFFTTNPSLVPTWVMRAGWPQRSESEGHFGLNLFASNPGLRSAFWGDGEVWVDHIGDVRAGVGY